MGSEYYLVVPVGFTTPARVVINFVDEAEATNHENRLFQRTKKSEDQP